MNTEHLEKALSGEIWSEPRPYFNLVELCDRFGPRFAGSPGYEGAAEWVSQRLREYGLVNVHQEPVEHMGWDRGTATLRVLEPYPAEFAAIALPYSPAGEVEAEMIDLWAAGPETFDQDKDRIAGKVVLTSGALPPGYPRGVHRTEKYGRAVQAGATGFLFGNGTPGQLPPTGSLAHGRAGEIVGLGVSAETAETLQRWLAQGPVRVQMSMQGGGSRPAVSPNVVADVPHGRADGPLVILCGHLDSHDIAPGAEDNGSGSVSVLEAARSLATIGAELPGRVRVILFTAEEVGLLGANAYVTAHADELGQIRMVLNADMTGAPGNLAFSLQGWPELMDRVRGYLRCINYEASLSDNIVPYSDHFPFAMAGVPSAMIASTGAPGIRGFAHSSGDTLEKVSAKRLQSTAMTLARMTVRILHEPEWPAHRTPEQVRDTLVQAGVDHALRVDGRWPF